MKNTLVVSSVFLIAIGLPAFGLAARTGSTINLEIPSRTQDVNALDSLMAPYANRSAPGIKLVHRNYNPYVLKYCVESENSKVADEIEYELRRDVLYEKLDVTFDRSTVPCAF